MQCLLYRPQHCIPQNGVTSLKPKPLMQFHLLSHTCTTLQLLQCISLDTANATIKQAIPSFGSSSLQTLNRCCIHVAQPINTLSLIYIAKWHLAYKPWQVLIQYNIFPSFRVCRSYQCIGTISCDVGATVAIAFCV